MVAIVIVVMMVLIMFVFVVVVILGIVDHWLALTTPLFSFVCTWGWPILA